MFEFGTLGRWIARQTGRLLGLSVLATLAMALSSGEAQAQYRNNSWGFYIGPMILLPSNNSLFFREQNDIAQNGQITNASNPARIGQTSPAATPYSTYNPLFGAEFNFKISIDQWWFKFGVNLGLLSLVADKQADAKAVGGTVIMAEFMAGPRVYLLTDNIRPFIDFGLRIPGLIYTTPTADIIGTNLKVWPAVYAGAGIEFIVTRDVGISLLGRYSLNLPLNFPFFHTVEGLAGIVLYM